MNKKDLKLFEVAPIVVFKKRVLNGRQKVTPTNNRRYKLHQKIKNICSLYSRQRLIEMPDGYVPIDKYILELINQFNYNLQFHIPIPNINNIEVIEPEIVTSKN